METGRDTQDILNPEARKSTDGRREHRIRVRRTPEFRLRFAADGWGSLPCNGVVRSARRMARARICDRQDGCLSARPDRGTPDEHPLCMDDPGVEYPHLCHRRHRDRSNRANSTCGSEVACFATTGRDRIPCDAPEHRWPSSSGLDNLGGRVCRGNRAPSRTALGCICSHRAGEFSRDGGEYPYLDRGRVFMGDVGRISGFRGIPGGEARRPQCALDRARHRSRFVPEPVRTRPSHHAEPGPARAKRTRLHAGPRDGSLDVADSRQHDDRAMGT